VKEQYRFKPNKLGFFLAGFQQIMQERGLWGFPAPSPHRDLTQKKPKSKETKQNKTTKKKTHHKKSHNTD